MTPAKEPELKYKATERYSFGYVDYRAVFGSSETPKKSWISLHGLQYASRKHQFPWEEVSWDMTRTFTAIAKWIGTLRGGR